MTEDEMVGWHHRLNGHGFGWTPVVGYGQGGLACYGSWGHKELDMTDACTHAHHLKEVQFSSVTQSCPTLCDPMNRSTPGLPVHHQLQEFTQTHVH